MQSTSPSPSPVTQRELIHRVNNFLSLVMTTSQAALDERLRYEPDRALQQILDGAGELAVFLKESRQVERRRSADLRRERRSPPRSQPARSQEAPGLESPDAPGA